MNPHASHSATPVAALQSLWGNRNLFLQMIGREVVGRYRGSVLGLAWSFFSPLLMLAIYTFVFSVVFKSSWTGSGSNSSTTEFALLVFVGMIVHGLFSEVLTRAPGIILINVNYVKKVIFPLEILPAVALGAALFHCLVSLVVLLAAFLLFNGYVQWTIFFVPIVFLPLVILTLGCAWILGSLGVFLRDIGQMMGLVTTVLMFLSPVFFPVTSLPEAYRPWMMANPLTFIIEQSRDVLIWGNVPDWRGLGLYTLAASFIAWGGYAWFQKTRNGFSDVL